MERTCSACQIVRPDEDFSFKSKSEGTRQTTCRECHNAYLREHYRKNPDKDVFEAWNNWKSHHAEIEAELGEWPGFCITHAPFERILPYACRDVDSLLRLWPILERMRRNVRRKEQQDWRTA